MQAYDAAMRTTVTIDDRLLKQAKLAAVRQGRTVSDLVDDALRLLLSQFKAAAPTIELPVFGGSGLRAGVDLEDRDGLTALLDEGEQRAAR
jgi:hypothetical protein